MNEEWLEVAKQLPLGHKRRMRHDCSESRDLLVSHGEQGYSGWCFRCGKVGFEPHGYSNLARLEELRNLNLQAEETQSNELPTDFTTDIPNKQAVWLYKAGISLHRAAHCGIGWSDVLQRIVIPIFDTTGRLRYWQARAVMPGQTPKYTNPPVSKTDLLYRVCPSDERCGKSRVVVTEDILSAIRIGKHIPAMSIMGTKTSDSQAAQLSEFEEVTYWLDPDKAGREGAIAGTRKLALVTTTSIVESPVDPKHLSDREIREYLNLKPNNRYEYHD